MLDLKTEVYAWAKNNDRIELIERIASDFEVERNRIFELIFEEFIEEPLIFSDLNIDQRTDYLIYAITHQAEESDPYFLNFIYPFCLAFDRLLQKHIERNDDAFDPAKDPLTI